MLADQHVDDMIEVPDLLTSSGECFLLRVQGESMIGAGILDGDYVVVRSQEDCDDGDIVAALVDGGEATVKRLRRRQGIVELAPENDAMQPFTADQIDVLGKVIGVFRRM